MKRYIFAFLLIFNFLETAPALPLEAHGTTLFIGTSANGVPVIDIARPNASGLSHNRYHQFNVEEQGVILNNSRTSVHSQLGGEIPSNPNLHQPARTILNEVIGPHISQLNGPIEVIGQKADVIIANPNGIYCNGCGFINTGRALLTTGRPQLGLEGGLTSFSVKGGEIGIGPKGLSAKELSHLDLIAARLVLEGMIESKYVRSVVGTQEVHYPTLQVQTDEADTSKDQETKQDQFSIDVKALGGIRAGEIYLVATSKGLGVNSEGRLIADSSQIKLTANGEVTFKGRTQIQAKNINNKGIINGKETQIQVSDTLNNTGQIHGEDVNLSFDTGFNTGKDALIAARSLDGLLRLSGREFHNKSGGLLFNLGDICVARFVSDGGIQTGRMSYLLNRSATIEAMRDLNLMQVDKIRNDKERFSVRVNYASSAYQEESTTPVFYYGGHLLSKVILRNTDEVWTKSIVEDSEPGRLLANRDVLFSGHLINDKSVIQVGGKVLNQGGHYEGISEVGAEWSKKTWEKHVQNFVWSRWFPYFNVLYPKAERGVHETPAKGDVSLAIQSSNQAITGHLDSIQLLSSQSHQRAVPALSYGDHHVIYRYPASQVTLNKPIIVSNTALNQIDIDPNAKVILHTNPILLNGKTYLSSDDFFEQIGIDPKTVTRYGDGFLEQRYLNEQVAALTGRRFLPGFKSTEEAYKALMDAAVAFAKANKLPPTMVGAGLVPSGQSLSLPSGQSLPLTNDLVFPVQTQIILPNGEIRYGVAPRLFLKMPYDLGQGSLLSAPVIDLTISGNVHHEGTTQADETLQLKSKNVFNLGEMKAQNIYLQAEEDIHNQGGQIQGQGRESRVGLRAGRDMFLDSVYDQDKNLVRVSGIGAGHIVLEAVRDMRLKATRIDAASDFLAIAEEGTLQIQSLPLAPTEQSQVYSHPKLFVGTLQREQHQKVGEFHVGGNAGFIAKKGATTIEGGNFNIGQWLLIAGGDIQITPAIESREQAIFSAHKGGFDYLHQSEQIPVGAVFKTGGTTLQSNGNIHIQGATFVNEGDTHLWAKNNIDIKGLETAQQATELHQNKRKTVFSEKKTQSVGHQTLTHPFPTIIAGTGNIEIQAGEKYQQESSTLTALGKVDVQAKWIKILDSMDKWEIQNTEYWQQKGLSGTANNALYSAGQTLYQMQKATSQIDNDRMKLLAGTTAGIASGNALLNVLQSQNSPMNPIHPAIHTLNQFGGVSASVGYGKKEGGWSQKSRMQTPIASALLGQDISLKATGEGKQSDMTIQGSDVFAQRDLSMISDGTLNILASFYQAMTQGDNWNQGYGMGLGVSTTRAGVSLDIGLQQGSGTFNSQQIQWRNSQLSGHRVQMSSGTDTTLSGAEVTADQITLNVGTSGQGHLKISSLQDVDAYQSNQKQESISASLCTPPFCTGPSSLAYNPGKTKMESVYQSVQRRTGIRAGSSGYQIHVNGSTDLTGATIASSAPQHKNQLKTETLTTRDIQNEAWYQAQQTNFGFGFNLGQAGQNGITRNTKGDAKPLSKGIPGYHLLSEKGIAVTPPIAMNAAEKKTSTTYNSIGSIESQANTLPPIFNPEEITRRFEIVRALTTELGTFVQLKAKQLSEKEQAYESLLKAGVDPSSAQINSLKQEITSLKDWAPGGSYRQLATAITGAASGDVMGSNTRFLQAATVNYLQSLGAEQIKTLSPQLGGEGSPAHIALHGLLACAGASAQDQNCKQASMGASAGVVINKLLGSTGEGLTTEEREARRNLVSSLIGGVATSLGSKDVAEIVTAAQIETENNFVLPFPLITQTPVTGAGVLDQKGMSDSLGEFIDKVKENIHFKENMKVVGEKISGYFKGDGKDKVGSKVEEKSVEDIGGIYPGAGGMEPDENNDKPRYKNEIDLRLDAKIEKQLHKRGWDKNSIKNTINDPYVVRSARNKINGNDATAYFNEDGSYVVRDNKNGNILQISDRKNPKSWVPDSTIQNPYRGK